MNDTYFTCSVCNKSMDCGTIAEKHLHQHEEETGEMTISVHAYLEDPFRTLADIKRVIDAVRKGSTTGTESISIKIQR